MFKISTIDTRSQRTLVVEGTLIGSWVGELRTTWRTASQELGGRKLVIDLGRLQFVDSRGCGAILSCLKGTTEAGGDLHLCGVTRPVRTVFDFIRLHRICDIFDTKEQAVAAFKTKKGGG